MLDHGKSPATGFPGLSSSIWLALLQPQCHWASALVLQGLGFSWLGLSMDGAPSHFGPVSASSSWGFLGTGLPRCPTAALSCLLLVPGDRTPWQPCFCLSRVGLPSCSASDMPPLGLPGTGLADLAAALPGSRTPQQQGSPVSTLSCLAKTPRDRAHSSDGCSTWVGVTWGQGLPVLLLLHLAGAHESQ